MRTRRKIITLVGLPAMPVIAYVGFYLLTSSLSREPIEDSGYYWYTRTFARDWEVSLFKPLLGLESAWRDGDFSWEVNRVK